MATSLNIAVEKFMNMRFPGHVYGSDELGDWKLELSELGGHVVGLTETAIPGDELVLALPKYMKEMQEKLNHSALKVQRLTA